MVMAQIRTGFITTIVIMRTWRDQVGNDVSDMRNVRNTAQGVRIVRELSLLSETLAGAALEATGTLKRGLICTCVGFIDNLGSENVSSR
jgi:hypothetical protein